MRHAMAITDVLNGYLSCRGCLRDRSCQGRCFCRFSLVNDNLRKKLGIRLAPIRIDCSTTTERGKSPERKWHCYKRVIFFFQDFSKHVNWAYGFSQEDHPEPPVIWMKKMGGQSWEGGRGFPQQGTLFPNVIRCRVSFVTGTSIKGRSSISASNTGWPSMRTYLYVWETHSAVVLTGTLASLKVG